MGRKVYLIIIAEIKKKELKKIKIKALEFVIPYYSQVRAFTACDC